MSDGLNVPPIENMDGYRLACTACSFSTVVDGDVDAVFDAIEAHQADFDADPEAHLVDFEVTSSH